MHEQTYDDARARRLIQLLRGLAARIDELQSGDALLAAGPELLKLMGDARSELFHYEVRCTYDSPEVAESRRIVKEARGQMRSLEFHDTDDEEPWRSR
jgi:hypothetical protein